LAQVGLAANHVREAEAGRRGVLEIGSSGPPMSARLPGVIRAFRAANPEITLNVRMMYSSDILEELKQRRIHVGFARGDMQAADVTSKELWNFPYHVVLQHDHPEAKRKSVRLERLSGETLITYPRALIGESYDQMIAFCHGQGFRPKAVEEVTSAASVVGLVACGLGISILPFTGGLDVAGVVTRPIASSREWRFPIAAYWRSDGHSPVVEALLDVAREI
jgi:DNA-binding transcriptional LysR family regulator